MPAIAADGSVVGTQYDGGGRVVATTDADGNTTQYKYDALGRKVEEIDADPDGNPNSGNGSPITLYEYDSRGNLQYVTKTYADLSGNPATTRTGDTNFCYTTTYLYDKLGRMTAEIQPDPNGAGGLPPPVTLYSYDANGNLQSVVDARGASDDNLDAYGNPTSGTSNDAAHKTQYVYDEKNRKIEEILPDPAGGSNTLHTWYYYDGDDHLQYVVNAAGAVGPRPTTFSSSAAYATQYVYDNLGRKIKEIDRAPDSNHLDVRPTTQYAYDNNGNVVSVVDPLGYATYYQYDKLGASGARPTRWATPRPRFTMPSATPCL